MGRQQHAGADMTQRAGSFVPGLIESLRSARKQGAHGGAIQSFVSGGVAVLNIFKNEGWYAAGSAWETWITAGSPGTVPPSGHTLTFLQHVVLQ